MKSVSSLDALVEDTDDDVVVVVVGFVAGLGANAGLGNGLFSLTVGFATSALF